MDYEAIYQEFSQAGIKPDDDCPPDVRHYFKCRDAGTSPALAEILATGECPQINGTDAQLWKGWEGDQFGSDKGAGRVLDAKYRGKARAAGVSTTGKRYMRSLARFAGDPKAWVSDTHDILRVAREQNLHVEGIVKHKMEDRDPDDAPKPS